MGSDSIRWAFWCERVINSQARVDDNHHRVCEYIFQDREQSEEDTDSRKHYEGVTHFGAECGVRGQEGEEGT